VPTISVFVIHRASLSVILVPTVRNEGPCYDDYIDTYNNGCNNPAEAFSVIDPAYGKITMCGQSGTYLWEGGSHYRDTDWYEIVLTESREIEFCCTAEFPLLMFLIDGTGGCGDYTTIESLPVDECIEGCISATVGPGHSGCGSDHRTGRRSTVVAGTS